MTMIATIICLVFALATALWTAILALRDRHIDWPAVILAALTELTILYYLGVRIADLAGGHHVSSLAVVIAYLAGLVLVVPVAGALAWAEPTKWGSITLGVGALVACALFARINQLWYPHG
jgi:hypothetical protein